MKFDISTLRLILQIGGGAASTLLPGPVGVAIGLATKALDGVESAIAQEAKNRGIPPAELRSALIAELDKSIPQTGQNIKDRIERIKNS